MESGQATILPPSKGDSASSWRKLLKAANCPTKGGLECVRALPAALLKDIVEHQALKFFPIHDGGVTWTNKPRVDRLQSLKGNSRTARVPILIGSNANDGGVFVYGALDVKAYLDTVIPPNTPLAFVNQILTAYPVGSPGILDVNGQLEAIYTEFSFQCPAAVVASDSKSVDIPAWRYYYNASFANSEIYPDSGAYHSAEIGPVFGTYPKTGATHFQREVSSTLQKAWADFAKHPTQGPGWKSVPEVAVLGGGARPGQSDVGRRAVTTIDPKQIDQRCGLYKVIYDLLTLL